jgi:uncharacterized membrane protein HdeD (DUF308 family)
MDIFMVIVFLFACIFLLMGILQIIISFCNSLFCNKTTSIKFAVINLVIGTVLSILFLSLTGWMLQTGTF